MMTVKAVVTFENFHNDGIDPRNFVIPPEYKRSRRMSKEKYIAGVARGEGDGAGGPGGSGGPGTGVGGNSGAYESDDDDEEEEEEEDDAGDGGMSDGEILRRRAAARNAFDDDEVRKRWECVCVYVRVSVSLSMGCMTRGPFHTSNRKVKCSLPFVTLSLVYRSLKSTYGTRMIFLN